MLFLLQNSIQNTMLYWAVTCFRLFLAVAIALSFLVFHALTIVEKCWSATFLKSLNLDMPDGFFLISIWDLGRNTTNEKCHFYIVANLHTIDMIYHCLPHWSSGWWNVSKFLHHKVTISPLFCHRTSTFSFSCLFWHFSEHKTWN